MTWTGLTNRLPGFWLPFALIVGSLVAGLMTGRAGWRKFLALPVLAVVVLVATGLLQGLFALVWDRGSAGSVHAIVTDVVTILLIGLVGFGVGKYYAFVAPLLPELRRGTQLIDGAAAQRRAATHWDPLSLKFGGLVLDAADETKHFKLIGTTGTGKSTAIRALLAGALARGDRAVIADPDGGYVERFYDPQRGDVILNPFDARSVKWDIFREVQQSFDIEQLARSLIADSESSAAGEWRGYARTFFSAVMRQSRALGNRDSRELYRLLTAAPNEELQILLASTPAQPFLADCNARFLGSLRSVLASSIAAFPYIDEQVATPFSVRDWVRKGRGVLFIPYRADQIAALRDLIATWMRLAIFQTMSEPEGDLRLWFIVDELDALGRIDGLKDALSRLRKFGGRCVLGLQSIGQVSTIYGQGEAQTIVENCGNTAIFRCSASEGGGTARFASKLIGEREVIRETRSRVYGTDFFSKDGGIKSTSTNQQFATESAVLASEIEQLADGAGFLKCASRPEWARIQFPDFRQGKVAQAFEPRA